MSVRCPICGAKLNSAQMCPYCQGVTLSRILNASNKKAKEKLKKHDSEGVFSSSTLPSDVNRVKLWLFATVLGFTGAHHFYVGRLFKGLFYVLSFGLLLVFTSLQVILEAYTSSLYVISVMISIFSFFSAIAFLLWMGDIFALLFHTYKVPVVLGDEIKIEQPKKGKKA